jgi:hypothetical protein
MNFTGENGSTRRKTCPSATLPTTSATWTDPASNPGLRFLPVALRSHLTLIRIRQAFSYRTEFFLETKTTEQ